MRKIDSSKVPSAKDWGDIPNAEPHTKAAFKDYSGKNCQEIRDKLKSSSIEMVDGLRWMPFAPRCFYLGCVGQFVASGEFNARDALELVDALMIFVDEKLKDDSLILRRNKAVLLQALELIKNRSSEFEEWTGIYGDFKERAEKLIPRVFES